jgi:hypothetical protein
MNALLKALKSNPKLLSALGGASAGVVGGAGIMNSYRNKKAREAEKKPDPIIMQALMPGAKDHLDEMLLERGYPFFGNDLRKIAKREVNG